MRAQSGRPEHLLTSRLGDRQFVLWSHVELGLRRPSLRFLGGRVAKRSVKLSTLPARNRGRADEPRPCRRTVHGREHRACTAAEAGVGSVATTAASCPIQEALSAWMARRMLKGCWDGAGEEGHIRVVVSFLFDLDHAIAEATHAVRLGGMSVCVGY